MDRLWMGLVAGLLFAFVAGGCRSGQSGVAGPGESGDGAVLVTARALSDAERVASVRVTLTPSVGAVIELALTPPAPGNTDWSQVQSVQPGTYTAAAVARDGDDELLFKSDPTAPFEVKPGQLIPVSLFLRQHPSEEGFEALYLASLQFDRAPAAGETLAITVRGEGGVGPLSLSGAGAGSFGAASGDARSPAGASIPWTPDQEGMRTIELTLSDGAGSTATSVVQLLVSGGGGGGDIDFTVHFNHAPYATIRSEASSAAASTEVALTARFFDDDTAGPLDYAWDFSACATEGLLLDGLLSEAETGSAAQDSPRTFYLGANDGDPRFCTATLVVTDRGAPSPAKQTQRVLIRTEKLSASCEGDLQECFGVCTDVQSDREHCGACYQLCAQGETCQEGACVQACAAGLAWCDGQCLDTESDPAACGNCHTACQPGEICSEGVCTCPGGWSVCGGVCTDTSSDDAHCGGCGQACAPDRHCEDEACVCTPPLESCGGDCVDTSQDDQHCGACGTSCPAGQHCDGGACVCDDGNLLACGALCVDAQSDDAFCGNCETSCEESESCQGGVCVPAPCPPGEMPCGAGGACVDVTESEEHCGACDAPCAGSNLCVEGACIRNPDYANWPVPPEDPPTGNYQVDAVEGTVFDTVTKLMWQRATAGPFSWDDAKVYCEQTLNLGGHSDWRLPSRVELISITALLQGSSPRWNPAILTTVFPNTQTARYWSSTRSGATSRWTVEFNEGASVGQSTNGTSNYVRCVRYGEGYPKEAAVGPRLTSHGTGSGAYVKDHWTGLLWQNANLSYADLAGAMSSCAGRTYEGKSARLPTRKELDTLLDSSRPSTPKWDPIFGDIQDTNRNFFWTSVYYGAPAPYFVDFQWVVKFNGIGTGAESVFSSQPFRCVAGP